MAWPTDSYSSGTMVRADFSADEACSQTRARGLRDIMLCMLASPLAIPDFSDSESGTSFVTAVSFELSIPAAWTGRTLYAEILAHNQGGGGGASGDAGQWRIRQDDAGTDGTATDVADTVTSATVSEASLAIASGWLGSTVTMAFQVRKTQAGGYTFDTSATQRLTMWVE